jgi:hypothetical protein
MFHMPIYFVKTRYKKNLIHICFTRQNYIHSMAERYQMKINLLLYVLHMKNYFEIQKTKIIHVMLIGS